MRTPRSFSNRPKRAFCGLIFKSAKTGFLRPHFQLGILSLEFVSHPFRLRKKQELLATLIVELEKTHQDVAVRWDAVCRRARDPFAVLRWERLETKHVYEPRAQS